MIIKYQFYRPDSEYSRFFLFAFNYTFNLPYLLMMKYQKLEVDPVS